MGDNHICSLCNEDLRGKQHIKIVFENWPVEETVIYKRKGKEARRIRNVTKEVITAIGMECIGNPDRWKDYDIDPIKVGDFFEDLRFAGKNPIFNAILGKDGTTCLSQACGSRTGRDCGHLLRYPSLDYMGLDELCCEVGHPGRILVRHGKREEERTGILNPIGLPSLPREELWRCILLYVGLAWKPEHGFLTKVYFTLSYSVPMLFMIGLYLIVAYPFWGMLCLKRKVITSLSLFSV